MRSAIAVIAILAFLGKRAEAQRDDLKLLGYQYVWSFGQEFVGKVIHGENVGESFLKSFYESAPPAVLRHVGMRMVAENWRLAIPAQLLIQKAVQVERLSIEGKPIISTSLLTSWELDYLWFNLRVKEGKPLLPKVNIDAVRESFRYGRRNFLWDESFTSGTVIWSTLGSLGTIPSGQTVAGRSWLGVIFVRPEYLSDGLLSHEIIHWFQEIRGGSLINPLFESIRFETKKPWTWIGVANLPPFSSFIRFDILGGYVDWAPTLFQNMISNPCKQRTLLEWEPTIYVDGTKRGMEKISVWCNY